MVIERVEVGAIEGVRQLLLSDMDRGRSSEEACDCFARHTALLQVSLRSNMLSTQECGGDFACKLAGERLWCWFDVACQQSSGMPRRANTWFLVQQ